MLTLEIRINGTLICHISAHNTGPQPSWPDYDPDACVYACEGYAAGRGHTRWHLTHDVQLGALALGANIVAGLDDKLPPREEGEG